MANLSGQDYIQLQGLYGKNLTGDMYQIGKTGGGHYWFIRDTLYNLASLSGRGWYISGDVAGLYIGYGYFDRADTNGKTITNGGADIFQIFGSYQLENVLIENSTFRRAAHSALNFKSTNGYTNYVVIQNVLFYGGRHSADMGSTSNYVFQNNVEMLAESISVNARLGTFLQTVDYTNSQSIIRGNVTYIDSVTITRTNDLDGHWNGSTFGGWSLNTPYNNEHMGNIYLYHNTWDYWTPASVAMEYGMILSANYDNTITGDYVKPVRFKNNIMIGLRTTYGSQTLLFERDPNDSYGNFDHIFANNIFNMNSGTDVVTIKSSTLSNATYSLSSMQTNYPSQWYGNSWTKPASWSHTNPTYALAATDDGYGDAGSLTTTTAGGSGTSMTVADARYFTDGMGLIPGDTIYVAGMTSSAWATVSSVNYGTNTITLGQSRAWNNGVGVYWYKDGGQAINVGAKQVAGGGIDPPTDWAPFGKIWAVDGSQYVQWNTRTSPARDNDSNSVWRGDSVHIFGLKNDVASFQVILEAGAAGVDSIVVVIDSLNHGTDVIKSASTSCSTYVDRDIESFLESYVYIDVRDTTTSFYVNALPGPDASYLGWIPEQLVPMEAPRKWVVHGTDTMQGGAANGGFKVLANKNAAVWFDVRIDKGKPAGTYAGSIKVKKFGGATLFTIPIELKVYNATLSDTNHFPVMTHYHHDALASRAGVTTGTNYYWNTYTKRLHFFMHRHRMDLIMSDEKYDSLLVRRMRYYSGWIFSNSNGYQGPGEGVGQKMYVAALWNCNFTQYPSPGFNLSKYGSYPADTQTGWRDLTDDFEQAFLDSAARVIRMVELIDEPYTDEQRNAIVTRSTWIRTGTGVGRKMHIMIPNGWMDTWFIESSPATGYSSPVSIWFQNPWAGPTEYNGYHTSRYWGEVNGPTVEYLRSLMANDSVVGMVATYNSLPGFTPEINSIDIPATYPRLWGWMAWEYNIPFYWAWTSTQWAWAENNPWENVVHYQGHDFDGNLFYYGRDNLYTDQDRGVNTPIASIRLKNLRDGIRDYEMLYLASQNNKLQTSWVDSVGMWAAFDDWRYWAHGETPKWATNGYTMEAIRREIAMALESGEPTPTLKRLIGRKR